MRIMKQLGQANRWRKVWLLFALAPALGLDVDINLVNTVLRAAARCRASAFVTQVLAALESNALKPDAVSFLPGITALWRGNSALETMQVCAAAAAAIAARRGCLCAAPPPPAEPRSSAPTTCACARRCSSPCFMPASSRLPRRACV